MKLRRTGQGPAQRHPNPGAANLNAADRRLVEVFRFAAESGMAQQQVLRFDAERFDADSINLTIDFRARLTQVYRDKFAALRALDFVPMLDAPIQQTSTGYIGEFLTRVGGAQLVTEVSTDIPLVAVKGTTFTGRVATYGAAGAWSQLDIFRAAVGLINLPVETQRAARLAVEAMTDALVSLGDTDAGIPGFLRHPDVSIVPFALGNWPTRTFEQILTDAHGWVGSLHSRVGYVEDSIPDTVLFPPAVKFALMGVRNTFGAAVWDQLVKELREMHGITVDVWSRLATANNTGGARVVAYRRNPQCLGAIIPMVYTEFQPQERGFQVLIPGMASCGGTVVIEPNTVTYGDNALS